MQPAWAEESVEGFAFLRAGSSGVYFVPCPLRSYPLPVTPCLSPGMATAALLRAQVVPLQGSFSKRQSVSPSMIPEGAMPGLLIEKIAPDYPPLALQARIEGT